MKILEEIRILTPPMPWDKPVVSGHGSSEIVVFLHGLWRSKASMLPIAKYIEETEALDTLVIPYHSVKLSYEECVKQVLKVLEQKAYGRRVSFVTHSLGGVILRGVLADTDRSWQLGRAVMLAPPHRGSQIVEWLEESPLQYVLGKASRYLRPAEIWKVAPDFTELDKLAIIMGRKNRIKFFDFALNEVNDGIVSVDDGKIEGVKMFIEEDVDHTFMMLDPKVQELARNFITEGAYRN